MTIDEVLELLASAKLEWYESFTRAIRVDTLDLFFHRCCPLTAACFLKTGKFFLTTEYDKAAKALGVSREDRNEIVNAADDNYPHDKGLRARMFDVLEVERRFDPQPDPQPDPQELVKAQEY